MASFAKDHGSYVYGNTLDWFESPENIPNVTSDISVFLDLNDANKAARYEELEVFLDSTLGKIVWHMFCLVAYNYDKKYTVEHIGVDCIVHKVNSETNDIYENERIHDLMLEMKIDGKPVLNHTLAPLFGRLFNYHHCVVLGRLPLFKLSPMSKRENHCPVCGCSFTAHGYVTAEPTKDVDVDRWSFEDTVEGGSKIHETKI